tara:strand:+ start:330 stop:500 length:171 start_codon:yes stop_codon:yes gene_type:complete
MEYRVYWTATVEGETVVEAENEDEAWQLVEDMRGEDLLYDIEEVSNVEVTWDVEED